MRVGLLEGKLVVNPTVAEQKTSLLNIVVAGTEEAIVMVESGALEVSEDAVADALEFAHAEIRKIVAAIRELHDKVKHAEGCVHAAGVRRSAAQADAAEIRRETARRLDTAKHPKNESYGLVDAIKAEIYAAIPRRTTRSKSSPLAPSSACANSSSATIC